METAGGEDTLRCSGGVSAGSSAGKMQFFRNLLGAKGQTKGEAKRAEGYEPCFPIVIIPGLCSSALQVEAGYDKWLNKRVWLSIKRMGLEKIRLRNNKNKQKFVDPEKPLFTPGFMTLRMGKLFKKWIPFYFFFEPSLK
jgi:hypothetical protein